MSSDSPELSPSLSLEAPPEALGWGGFWRFVREALRGARHDLTTVPLGRAVLLLAIPMVLEMIMEALFAVSDIFWVAKVGPEAVAAVGLTESLLTLIYSVAMGVGTGAVALVARRIGAQDQNGAARASVQALALGVVLGVVMGVPTALAAPRLLALMGGAPTTVALGTSYARIMLLSSVIIVPLFLVTAAFRGAGDATVAMRTLVLANGLNILFGPLFVFGIGPFPRLGVTGAAVATCVGRGVGVLYLLAALAKGRGHLRVTRENLVLHTGDMVTMLRIALGGIGQMLIGTASWIALMRIVAVFGSSILAGYTIAIRLILFALFPAWGMANAAATLVGQNLGAGRPERAEQAVWKAARYNFFFLGVVGIFFLVAAPLLLRAFSADPEVLSSGTQCLRIVAAGFFFYAYGMVMGQAFNGAGDTRTPTWLNVICFWLFELPVAFFLSRTASFGPMGVFAAITLSFSLMAVLSVMIFRRGHWKTVQLEGR